MPQKALIICEGSITKAGLVVVGLLLLVSMYNVYYIVAPYPFGEIMFGI